MADIERRFTSVPVEVRVTKDKPKIGGYAAVFNRFSHNLGGFVESVETSAFNKSRGDGWPGVMARHNHDDNMLLGNSDAGTLRLSVDDTGLVYEVDVPNSRADVFELVERGDIRKSSFAFRVPEGGDTWDTTDQGFPHRKLMSVQLVDVAPVNVPAYPDATAGLRSLAKHFDADPEEIRTLAENDELRKLFVKTSDGARPKRTTTGAAARMKLLGTVADPWAESASS